VVTDPTTLASQVTLTNITAIVLAVGALGAAAFGVVEAFGKSVASSTWKVVNPSTGEIAGGFRGLPYVGFKAVQDHMAPLAPALTAAYGPDYQKIILGQYRYGRGAGEAPATLRQGVRIGLSMLDEPSIEKMIHDVWGARPSRTARLASALAARNANIGSVEAGSGAVPREEAEALLASFITALDARQDAAFSLAEERYTAAARGWAAIAALVLALGLNFIADATGEALPWGVAGFVGVVAVPLAPISKDLAKAIADAVGAFRTLRTGR
jgi:hypothetical protein